MDIKFDAIEGGFLGHYNKTEDIRPAYLHYHDVYELYYFLDGERNYLTHSKIYPLETDWVTLTRPYVVHGTNGKKYERLLIFFSEDFLSTYFQSPMIELFHEVFSVDAISAQVIRKTPRIKELFFLIEKDSTANDLKMAAIHLGELLLLLYKAIKLTPTQTNTSTLPTKMQEILAYISNNVSTIKTLDQVAEHFFVSKSHLFHQFKSSTGFTFVEFLTKLKISRALHLLKHTKDSVNSISQACGFDTPEYFSIVFKKKMNMTPLQYRAWINKKNPVLHIDKHEER